MVISCRAVWAGLMTVVRVCSGDNLHTQVDGDVEQISIVATPYALHVDMTSAAPPREPQGPGRLLFRPIKLQEVLRAARRGGGG